MVGYSRANSYAVGDTVNGAMVGATLGRSTESTGADVKKSP